MLEHLSGKGCLRSSLNGVCVVWDHCVPLLSFGKPKSERPEGVR